MQNRRILDKLAASTGVSIKSAVVNSFLGVCSHLRHGEWSGIVPHIFFYVFGAAPAGASGKTLFNGLVHLPLVMPARPQGRFRALSRQHRHRPVVPLDRRGGGLHGDGVPADGARDAPVVRGDLICADGVYRAECYDRNRFAVI